MIQVLINVISDFKMNIIQTEFDFDFIENNNKVVTDEKIKRFDQSNTIKNISTDQSEILYNIMKLYNNGEAFECDMTASELKFYGDVKGASYKIPVPKILFDVYPSKDFIKKITPFQKLPLEDKSIKSIVVDLPFVISPKTAPSQSKETKRSNMIAKRFGCWYPYMEAYENMYWWMKECERVISDDGIIVWKMQNTISAKREHSFEEFSFICAQNFGLYVIDEFILKAKTRLISGSKIKTQQHSRKYTSRFYVFKKEPKFAYDTNCLRILEQCKNQELEGKVWPIK